MSIVASVPGLNSSFSKGGRANVFIIVREESITGKDNIQAENCPPTAKITLHGKVLSIVNPIASSTLQTEALRWKVHVV